MIRPAALALALLAPSLALSAANQTTVDCTDDITAMVCSECLGGDPAYCQRCIDDENDCITNCGGNVGCQLACHGCDDACGDGNCCEDPDACDVSYASIAPPVQLLPLNLKAAVGPATLGFQRKGVTKNDQTFVGLKLQETVRFSGGKKSLAMKTVLTGTDALVGSLLYPVVFLGNGQNALSVLQSHGFNVSLAGTPPTQTCQAIASQSECFLHALRLARQLDVMLGDAGDPETPLFEAGLQTLGVDAFGGTTTTTTASSTTTTTMCPGAQTNCSGTCVDLTNNNENCGHCGNVCPNGTLCSGGNCLIP